VTYQKGEKGRGGKTPPSLFPLSACPSITW
jgi:hypothetical protein